MAPNRPQTSIRLDVSIGSSTDLGPLARHVRSTLRSRHRQATLAGPFCAVRDIFTAEYGTSSDRRWHRGPYPHPIAEVLSTPAASITPEVIHGHRPRPHRRCCSCFIISRASRRDAYLEILRLGRNGAAPYKRIHFGPSRQSQIRRIHRRRLASVRSIIPKAVHSRTRTMRRLTPEPGVPAAQAPPPAIQVLHRSMQ
jgi:hypothetical protein